MSSSFRIGSICRQWVLAMLAITVVTPMIGLAADPAPAPLPWPVVVDHVRFYPAKDRANAMLGGKIAGSNTSASDGYQTLAEIKELPKADEWTDLNFANHSPYRWVRYEAPTGSHGAVAEIEFYSGEHKLKGGGFSTPGSNYQAAMDGKLDTFFNAPKPDGQYIGLDLNEQASAGRPGITPAGGEFDQPQTVKITSRTPGTTIRYTLDGTIPGPNDGQVYSGPIAVDKDSTITAVTFKDGLAPSPATTASLLIGKSNRRVLHSFHVGNSLTGNAARFPIFFRTAGGTDTFPSFLMGGALTHGLWKAKEGAEREHFDKIWASAQHPLDYFTMQPRDFDIDREAEHCVKFMKLVQEKSPDVQPWLYAEWVERSRTRPSDKGIVPSAEMKKTFPALTWQESMGAMLLYNEEVQRRIIAANPGGKRVRIIPTDLALGWARTMIDKGEMPGIKPGEDNFYTMLFADTVHVNQAGCYLVDLTWYAALLKESPEGKMLPIQTELTSAQAKVLQKLAWDVIKNYPDCGLYEDGATPCGKPQIITEGKTITLSSSTPGAWFRYTLDGTPPTRTNGYVYCGVISAQPGIHVKAIAFKSGMADSEVTE